MAAAGEVPRDRQVSMLAGDYCCYQEDQGLSDSARLDLALANLDRVGAVVVTEHMSESLQVGGGGGSASQDPARARVCVLPTAAAAAAAGGSTPHSAWFTPPPAAVPGPRAGL